MALYATFLALVGVPLLALNIDVARVYVAKARLRNATQAYGTMIDSTNFRDNGDWGFQGTAMDEANHAFYRSIPSGGSVSVNVIEKNPDPLNHIFVVECRGRLIVSPLMWVGVPYYTLNQFSQVKVKFATTENWLVGH